ncbi:MAG: hypothetical protein IJR72_05440 [Oscillospiraceae bacterium]|nr:hypothetical protein [Oscillospiraceae bacterium]
MKKKLKRENIFREGDAILPSLYWDMILAEYIRPILFTCVDKYNFLYICSCFYAGADAVKWILVKTTEEAVIQLLQNQIPIHDIFSNAEDVYLLTLSERGAQPQAVKNAARDVPEHYFPTAGYDMDAEDGEFDEEIAELRERIAERESAPYEDAIPFIEETYLFSYYMRKQNLPDIVEMKYADFLPSDAKQQMDSYYRERQFFTLFFSRKQTNVSGFQRNPQAEGLFRNRSAFVSVQVPACSISAC